MASITRKPTSPYWIACFTDQAGTQRQKSTKETDKKKALKRAATFEEAARGRLNEVQARKVLAAMFQEVNGEDLKLESVRTYVNNWLKRKEQELKRGTWLRYETAGVKFLRFLALKADRELGYITHRDILAFRDATASRLSNSSANTDLKILRIIFGQAWRDGLLPQNPATQVSLLKVQRGEDEAERRPFTLSELKALLALADDEWRGMILVGLYTGQRLGDIVRLKWGQVDMERRELSFTTRKTGRRVIVPCAETLATYLTPRSSNKAQAAPVFPNNLELVRRSKGDVRRCSDQFYELMREAGLVPKRSNVRTGRGHGGSRRRNPLSFHALRHTATSLLKNAGVSSAVAMDIIGHDSPEISKIYTHIDDQSKRAAIATMPNIDDN